MKINGKVLSAPSPVQVEIFRGEDSLTFVANAVLDYSEFDRLLPEPKPPLKTIVATQTQYPDVEDKRYKVAMEKYGKQRYAYMIIKALSGTPGLEWDEVDLEKPDTWEKWSTELRQVMTQYEINTIISGILEANSPSKKRRKEAIGTFTLPPQDQVADQPTSPTDEPTNTQSTEPANASA